MIDMRVRVGSLVFDNPLLAASGTYGFGREMSEFYRLDRLGGIVTKAVTREPRIGNPPHRIAETAGGMLNAVGLQNPGIDSVLRDELPWLLKQHVPVVVNIAGRDLSDYVVLTDNLVGSGISAVE